MKRLTFVFAIVGIALMLGGYFAPGSAKDRDLLTFNGKKIIIPESSVPRPGHISTQYFFVGSRERTPQPPPGVETPGSVACVYELVPGPTGCPVNTSTAVPTGGVGAIAIVDAGYYPTAASDLEAFDNYYNIPSADFQVVYANGQQPPEYSDWEVEEALDIEWAHAMAPKAKLFLVESVLCTSNNCNTDPTWQAVEVAGKLVSENGGGVVSMSWGDPEWPQEVNFDKYFTAPNVVYFSGSGDYGLNFPFHPAASPNVVSVGGTYFNRDNNGNFTYESYYTGGGGGAISTYEKRPSYQNIIQNIVGTQRGFPDVGSDFCCAPIYLQGWTSVGGTSWGTPTVAGIVNAAGVIAPTSFDAHVALYKEFANPKQYKAWYYDITQGDPACTAGWNLCAGIGSLRTYHGK
jgi:kumamolisin